LSSGSFSLHWVEGRCKTVQNSPGGEERGSPRWCNWVVARALALVGATAVALVLASAAEAAAPRYIMVSGPSLAKPVLLANWAENGRLVATLVNARRAGGEAVRLLSKRPRLRLGLFWGWSEKPRPSRPGQANQTGWFYPSWRSQPSVIDLLVNRGPSSADRARSDASCLRPARRANPHTLTASTGAADVMHRS
jgi:hypothetical protein